VWNLVKAGEVSVDIALHSLEYLDTEMDYVPWAAALRELYYLSDMLRETEVFGDFQVCFDHILKTFMVAASRLNG
jgi:hypothetical protein